MMKWAMAVTCCILLGLALPGRNSGQTKSDQQSAAAGNKTTNLQIQSPILRIEFDRNLHSRILALFGPSPTSLSPFSATETVAGSSRNWNDFALSSTRRETVSDAFGAGERLSLTGQSGDLRKNISVTIYTDFPSIAIFDVEYANEGASRLTIRGWTNHQYVLPSLPTARGPAFWSYQSGSYEKRPD